MQYQASVGITLHTFLFVSETTLKSRIAWNKMGGLKNIQKTINEVAWNKRVGWQKDRKQLLENRNYDNI